MFSLPVVVKTEIERTYGRPLMYPADCQGLAISIRESINETIGVTTLKRLFGFVSDVMEPRVSTLDVLARYCGFSDYGAMTRELAGNGDSDFEKAPDISSYELAPGSIVGFDYLPDRRVRLRYLGDCRFEVTESENGSLQVGDIIIVTNFIENSPMIASSVIRNGIEKGRYTAGQVSGIANLYLESPSDRD